MATRVLRLTRDNKATRCELSLNFWCISLTKEVYPLKLIGTLTGVLLCVIQYSKYSLKIALISIYIYSFVFAFLTRINELKMLRIVDFNRRNKSKGTLRLHLEFILK